MNRLSELSLDSISAVIERPTYNREGISRVVHLGVGAFHRGHQAVYFDELMKLGHQDWMIRGVSLRSPNVPDKLNPQNGYYTVLEEGADRNQTSIIGSIQSVYFAPESPSSVVNALADSDTSLVTMTITEKGYYIDQYSGLLMIDHPSIIHDIANPDKPITAPGFLVAGLAKRHSLNLPALTILSCDNLPHNGELTRKSVVQLARINNPKLADWIETSVCFPSSMVDRIVPATVQSDIDFLEKGFGYVDEALVKTETYSQWVIEDCFASSKPPLNLVGAQFTQNVAAWETAKLRMLNGAHSAIAYLGGLAGKEYVHDFMASDKCLRFLDALWTEVMPTLDKIEGFDPASYKDDLILRFQNASLNHRTHQIAMDGSQKIQQRLINTVCDRRSLGFDSPHLCKAIAGWICWQRGVSDLGVVYKVEDPISDVTRDIFMNYNNQPQLITQEMLKLNSIFPERFLNDVVSCNLIAQGVDIILRDGASSLLKEKA